MKLAYLTNQYPKISHTFIRREILALEAQGIDVTRFSIRRAAENFPDAQDQQELVRTRFLLDGGTFTLSKNMLRVAAANPRAFAVALRQAMEMGWQSQRGLARHFAYLAEACVLKNLCAARGITHLHVHHATNPAAVALLCQTLGGPPYSLTVHGPEEFENAAQLALPTKIARAAFVVSVSEWGRTQLFRHCDAAQRHKIYLIRNGVEENFAEFAPRPIQDTPRFLWVGRLAEQKNPMLLLDAITHLRNENIFCTVTLLGDGPLRAGLEHEIARRALGDRIELKGWANYKQILKELQQVRALVISSRAENTPTVILETLLQERPVISANIGGVPEMIDDDKTGWLVSPNDAPALAEAMRRALETPPETLQHMGRLGRKFILEHFDGMKQTRALRRLLETYASPRTKGN